MAPAAIHGTGWRLVCRPAVREKPLLPVAHEFPARAISLHAVKSQPIEIESLAFKLLAGVTQLEEGFDVHRFIAKTSIDRFRVAIVDRLLGGGCNQAVRRAASQLPLDGRGGIRIVAAEIACPDRALQMARKAFIVRGYRANCSCDRNTDALSCALRL